ncbi:MAG: thioredoxin family protein [Flavobacteriaceae bacterium]|nr:thioredoxin family protein [Flavobacteriaceae bacterium]
MSRTASNMLPLGTRAPSFNLKDTISNKYLTLEELKGGKATVIFFICNHCPFVIHINEELVKIANNFSKKGVSFIAISSNDIINYPQDAPNLMHEIAKKIKYPFPYLFDETQNVAKAFDAACTPDIYVFDKNSELVYRGQLDDSRPGNKIPVTGKDLRKALQNLLDGSEVLRNQKPSIGCNIKWKG